jgi:hypothetical protein
MQSQGFTFTTFDAWTLHLITCLIEKSYFNGLSLKFDYKYQDNHQNIVSICLFLQKKLDCDSIFAKNELTKNKFLSLRTL